MKLPYLGDKVSKWADPAQVNHIPLMKFKLLMGRSLIVISSFPPWVVTAFRRQLKIDITPDLNVCIPADRTTPSHPWTWMCINVSAQVTSTFVGRQSLPIVEVNCFPKSIVAWVECSTVRVEFVTKNEFVWITVAAGPRPCG